MTVPTMMIEALCETYEVYMKKSRNFTNSIISYYFWRKIPERYALLETNIAPENRPSQKETRLPTIHFQVRKC